ncbi:MAG: hypothetical protein ACD_43C00166G0006 [uncultured bacterium]|nr:MAG: hypothetical protein ACD_43C00166G0006 [uncultured bacterium]
MMLITITYFTVVVIWIIMFGIEYLKPHLIPIGRRILLGLFVASLVVLVAWLMNSIWLSLIGSAVALAAFSLGGSTMGRWFKERFNLLALILWVLWFTTISLVLAHLIYIYRFFSL